jgi:predicted GNAT superfamily acetyltransferase
VARDLVSHLSPSRYGGQWGVGVWRLTSPRNEDLLICINAPFLTQHIWRPIGLGERNKALSLTVRVTQDIKTRQYYVVRGGSLVRNSTMWILNLYYSKGYRTTEI